MGGGGSKKCGKGVTYYLNGPLVILIEKLLYSLGSGKLTFNHSSISNIFSIFAGAGATFDWMFFDNSKLIEFDN
jgi:hypothetical protein